MKFEPIEEPVMKFEPIEEMKLPSLPSLPTPKKEVVEETAIEKFEGFSEKSSVKSSVKSTDKVKPFEF
jgi:hypothetical protein